MALLLFNWLGYRLVLNYFQQQSDLQLETRIDAHNYDESLLVEIRIPLNMPYQARWTEFERHYGEIELDGKHYSYVKRKVEAGVLVLKCIANPEKDLIKNAGQELLEASNGVDQDKGATPSPLAKLAKCSLTDFDNYKTEFTPITLHIPNREYLISKISFVLHGYRTTAEQPPDHSLFA
jgi:hypothetical protein